MATITIEDPDTHGTKTVDGQGRLYLGKRYAEKDVKFTIEVIEE